VSLRVCSYCSVCGDWSSSLVVCLLLPCSVEGSLKFVHIHIGIAVGAGELQEDIVKDLDETRVQLRRTEKELADARRENEELKAQLASTTSSRDEL
jgi:septal ring factor EnvC (AmiA/AmiB activator)